MLVTANPENLFRSVEDLTKGTAIPEDSSARLTQYAKGALYVVEIYSGSIRIFFGFSKKNIFQGMIPENFWLTLTQLI